MFLRYLKIAILAATAATALSQRSATDVQEESNRDLADFNWDVGPEDGYPIIAFNDATENGEAVFKYNFTGDASDPNAKYLNVTLWQFDCLGAADATALSLTDSISGDELNVGIDVVQATIASSTEHYVDFNGTAAEITFCVRVDYMYVDPVDGPSSVNFHETKVTISVDLLANFTLTAINVDRTNATAADANAKLDYPVIAYFCNDANENTTLTQGPIFQGGLLEVCIMTTTAVENVYVRDILTFVITQPNGPAEATPTEIITNATANALTNKDCTANTDGKCNVQTQLLSKYFIETLPKDLRIDGIAILAFGPDPGPPAVRRLLRTPIRGLLSADDVKAFLPSQEDQQGNAVTEEHSQRKLQVAPQDGESQFGLQIGLQGDIADSQGSSDNGSSGSTILVAVIVLVILAAGCGLGFVFCTRKRRKQEKEDIVTHHSSTYATNQSCTHGNKNDYYSNSIAPSSVYTSGKSYLDQQRSIADQRVD
jgi:hypothetical protein